MWKHVVSSMGIAVAALALMAPAKVQADAPGDLGLGVISQLDTSDAWDVVVHGQYAYLADGANGVLVIDVSDPRAPEVVGRYGPTYRARGIDYADGHVVVADDWGGILILDVSDPTTPTLVRHINAQYPLKVKVSGDHAYVSCWSTGLVVVDISDPSNASVVATIDPGTVDGVDVADDVAYLSMHDGGGVVAVDVSTPSAPSVIGSTGGIAGRWHGIDLTIRGDYAFVGSEDSGLTVVDVSNPAAPTVVGRCATTLKGNGVQFLGDYALVADWGESVDVVDVSDPTAPARLFSVDLPAPAHDLAVVGDLVYVADTEAGLLILRRNSPPVADAGADVDDVEATSECRAEVALDATGSFDPDGDDLTYEWSVPADAGVTLDDAASPTPTGVFPLGPTLLTLTVTDGNGGVAFDDVLVTVVDNAPPVLVCTTDLIALWPANHRMVAVSVSIVASDACVAPEDLLVSCTVQSSEADDAHGDGRFVGDVGGFDGGSEPVPLTLTYDSATASYVGTISLRAERDGATTGRSYSIVCTVEDSAGNAGTASCVVVVPHDRRSSR